MLARLSYSTCVNMHMYDKFSVFSPKTQHQVRTKHNIHTNRQLTQHFKSIPFLNSDCLISNMT